MFSTFANEEVAGERYHLCVILDRTTRSLIARCGGADSEKVVLPA